MSAQYFVEFDELVEDHGEAEAATLFEQYKSTPPKAVVDRRFA